MVQSISSQNGESTTALKVPLAFTNSNTSPKPPQISGHCLPMLCPKAPPAVNLNVRSCPSKWEVMHTVDTVHPAQRAAINNRLQLSALSVFITWSAVHWKPQVKINLSTTISWEKNCYSCFFWQAHTDSAGIATPERVIKNWSCLRAQWGLEPHNIHPNSVCYDFIAKTVCHATDHASLQGLIFPCCLGSQESEGIISSSKGSWTARTISLKVS